MAFVHRVPPVSRSAASAGRYRRPNWEAVHILSSSASTVRLAHWRFVIRLVSALSTHGAVTTGRFSVGYNFKPALSTSVGARRVDARARVNESRIRSYGGVATVHDEVLDIRGMRVDVTMVVFSCRRRRRCCWCSGSYRLSRLPPLSEPVTVGGRRPVGAVRLPTSAVDGCARAGGNCPRTVVTRSAASGLMQ
jgi:hypothetical protein